MAPSDSQTSSGAPQADPDNLVYHHDDDEVDLLISQITRRKNQLNERMNADIELKAQCDATISALHGKLNECKNRCAKREIARDTYNETIRETEGAFAKVIATADAVAGMLNADVAVDDPLAGSTVNLDTPKPQSVNPQTYEDQRTKKESRGRPGTQVRANNHVNNESLTGGGKRRSSSAGSAPRPQATSTATGKTARGQGSSNSGGGSKNKSGKSKRKHKKAKKRDVGRDDESKGSKRSKGHGA